MLHLHRTWFIINEWMVGIKYPSIYYKLSPTCSVQDLNTYHCPKIPILIQYWVVLVDPMSKSLDELPILK